jgi:hypothetical protein
MDAFEQELLRRSPRAAAVLSILDFACDDASLNELYRQHKGRCYEDVLTFPTQLRLIRDALLRHEGRGHKLFVELERRDAEPVDESNFYRKLARTPTAVSHALLSQGAARMGQLLPAELLASTGTALPPCFDGFAVLAADGKKIKKVARRLLPTRGFRGGALLGAKALVALDLRTKLALAMSSDLDGETNDIPLVPDLIDQLRRQISDPILSVWDRQFTDAGTMRLILAREGDHFVIRIRSGVTFTVEPGSTRRTTDENGRTIVDEIGTFGSDRGGRKGAHPPLRLRRIIVLRPGDPEGDVVLLSSLVDREQFPAVEIAGLYRQRWQIEQVFQQVTETFSLQHLIGCSPRAVLLQLSLCLLLYNGLQVVKHFVAEDGRVLASVVSMYYLFHDVRDELKAWAYHGGDWPASRRRSAPATIVRLRALLRGSWDPVAYVKYVRKKPAKPKSIVQRTSAHTSVQRLLKKAVA